MSSEIHYDGERLTVTREFDAPRAEVFSAWVENSKVQLWWGCARTTKTESCVEQRVGGKYEHTMHLEGIGEFQVHGLILEYEPPARLVYEATDAQQQGPTTTVSVVFEELAPERTRVTLTQVGTPEEFVPFVKDGWSAAFEKLARFLPATAA